MEEFYYKMLDEQGNLIGLLTCSSLLGTDERQVTITAEEYAVLHAEMYEHMAASERTTDEGDDA